MSRTDPLLLVAFAALSPAASADAQNLSIVPAACAELPGNAALSMPLRWSEGTLQVRIDAALLPPNFLGRSIQGLRLRRPAFLGEPAYPALQRTLTIRGGFDTRPASFLTSDRALNRPPTLVSLFGPSQVSVPATSAQGPATQAGAEFLAVQFTTPLMVVAGNLFLEFEATDAPFQVLAQNWVDAVWFDSGVENGYVVAVGDGSCTTRAAPTQLVWNDPASGPVVGGTAAVRLTGAMPPPTNGAQFVFTWLGLDPIPRAAGPGYVGFGNSVTALDPTLTGCHQWAPLDAVWGGTTDAGGSYSTSFPLTQGVAIAGMRIGVQAAWVDLTRSGLPLSVSNGLMLVVDNIGVQNHCACSFYPGTATTSPWFPFIGQMPVIGLDHN